ncbi:MAG TPA: S41 family peptidase [Anaerolineae bacterium]|nr:S41 family peptidase [Anaerolineae bacterium]
MDSTIRNVTRCMLASTILLVLTAGVFLAGFGSAYLLVGGGVLPTRLAAAPETAPEPSPPSPAPERVEVEGGPDAGPTPTPVPIPTPSNEDEETFQLFWEVWDLVQRHFYGELPDMQELTYAAIRGMLSTLGDDYTAFIESSIAAIISEDATGEFEGIGAFVGMDEEGTVEIVEPFEGGPAEQAGIRAGDRVLGVDGVSIVGVTLYEAIGLIRGPEGTEVTLLIEREGVAEPFEVTVTRARLEIAITEVELRDDGIGYIRLYDFSATAGERMVEGLEELLAQEPQAIIFDLRGNPGGWLDQAVDVADLFLDDGAILIERWSDGREKSFEAHPGDVGEDVPLVVLVDRGSASAAEIVAGALQDRERAVLIGELTFGKGSVQRPFTLSDGSELRVTAALWFTPNNRAIHGDGLAPDIEVPWPEEEVEPDVDPQLERAVEYILAGE